MLNRLKSLFVVTEEVEQQPKENTKDIIKETNQNQIDKIGVFNQEIYDQLTQAIEAVNLPGEDYLEFVEALNAMRNLPINETAKMQSVMAMLSTKGLTVQKIEDSATFYLQILEKEKQKYNENISGEVEKELQGSKLSLKEMEKIAMIKQKEIEKLNQELQHLHEEIARQKNELLNVEDKIKEKTHSFNFTFDAVANQIKTNVEKVKQLV